VNSTGPTWRGAVGTVDNRTREKAPSFIGIVVCTAGAGRASAIERARTDLTKRVTVPSPRRPGLSQTTVAREQSVQHVFARRSVQKLTTVTRRKMMVGRRSADDAGKTTETARRLRMFNEYKSSFFPSIQSASGAYAHATPPVFGAESNQ